MDLTQPALPAEITAEIALSTNIPVDLAAAFSEEIDLARDLSASMTPGMSEYQIKRFVAGDVDDRVTPFGVHQQSVREIGTRYEGIISLMSNWEQNQAHIRIYQSRLELLELEKKELLQERGPKTSAQSTLLTGRIQLLQAKLDDILRRMPLLELQGRDTIRQLRYFIEVYKEVTPQIDFSLGTLELDRIEWEAKVITRYFKGRFNYIPNNYDTEHLAKSLELAMDLRLFGFTDDDVKDVAGQGTWELRKQRYDELVDEKGYTELQALLPLDGQDQLPPMIHQRNQAMQAARSHLLGGRG